MVPLKGIQKAHPRMAHSCVHQLVNLRHWERVLWAGFVQVCKIYTYAPLPRILLYHYGVSQPFRVKNLFNSPSLLKFHHLVLYSIRMFLGQTSRWLLPRGDKWTNIQMMADEAQIHSQSFVSNPSEYINVLLEKHYQLLFLLMWQLSSNLKKLFRIVTNGKFL